MYSKIAFTDQVQMSTFQFFGEKGGEGETFSTPLSRVQVVRRRELLEKKKMYKTRRSPV